MIEDKFTIKPNQQEIIVAEDRIFHFCQDSNVGNYYSAVCYATVQALKMVINDRNISGDANDIAIECGFAKGGVYTMIKGIKTPLSISDANELPAAEGDSRGDERFVVKSLCDSVEEDEDKGCLKLFFSVKGIDERDAQYRKAVLSKRMTTEAVF